ncbi:MAG TPA: DUF5996 family protein [Thermoanaerobaculia bacterium]|jgi:hypothetical protein|nr:DUF5996 family protein [Thermoanaerobaculia bacterium]
MSAARTAAWPELALADWAETRDTLHLWTQIVGKVRLKQTPWINHAWNTTLYVTSRGLTTSPMPHGERVFQIDFDFIDQVVLVTTVEGERETIVLRPRTVASFYQELMGILNDLGLPVTIHPHASEIPGETIDLSQDTRHEAYDPDYAQRFWRVLVSSHRVLQRFRSPFQGKASPVHFFWGSFDLSLTLFSGRPATPVDMKMPHMPRWVTRDASIHEQAAFGFWPGNLGGAWKDAAFYAYAIPKPDGYETARVRPAGAIYPAELGEWILPYEPVRKSADPDADLLAFLEDTYAAAADLGKWDRASLERTEELPPRG